MPPPARHRSPALVGRVRPANTNDSMSDVEVALDLPTCWTGSPQHHQRRTLTLVIAGVVLLGSSAAIALR